jgi:hypothetical protein
MKRIWLILLSLGLVMAFSASAFAVDVKFSGSFYAAGMYQDKVSFVKAPGLHLEPVDSTLQFWSFGYGNEGPSTAFYYQRLRIKTEIIVTPALKLVTRFDAMERAWGAPRSTPGIGTVPFSGDAPDRQSAGTTAENENIAFDWAYVEYTSPIGMFMVGYQDDGAWGTVFGDSSVPQGGFTWVIQKSGLTAFIQILKIKEQNRTAKLSSTAVDNDTDKYQAGVVYEWKGGEAGLLGVYYRDRSSRPDTGARGNIYVLEPYAIVKLGPVKIQAEVDYAFGKIRYDDLVGYDMKIDNLAGWIDATADLKMFYFGGTFAYVAGNDWNDPNKVKGGFLTGGMDWNPTLLLFNNEREYWAGEIPGNFMTSSSMNFMAQAFGIDDTGMYNAWFFQARAGVRPIDKLDIMASVSYAMADSKTLPGIFGTDSGDYGTEIDLIGTYKITNNLTYMLGAGYLFTGDYFKGASYFDYGSGVSSDVRNNFIIINKLTLTF